MPNRYRRLDGYEGEWYDTFVIPAGPLTERQHFVFCNLEGKGKIDTNFAAPCQIHHERWTLVSGLRVYVPPADVDGRPLEASLSSRLLEHLHVSVWLNLDELFVAPAFWLVRGAAGVRPPRWVKPADRVRCTVDQMMPCLWPINHAVLPGPVAVKVVLRGESWRVERSS